MKLITKMISIACMAATLASCSDKTADKGDFRFLIDEFADLKIMRYQVPGWEELTLQQKEYIFHLSEAAKYGRDIYWAQNSRYGLPVRKVVENILNNYESDRSTEEFKAFETHA